MIVKVCGMREAENIRELDALGIDIIGFIFYDKSPRYVSVKPSVMPQSARRAGVFVNAHSEKILAKAEEFGLEYIQLHGNEAPSLCKTMKDNGLKVIKAFSIASREDFAACADYEDCCDLFLFDTKTSSYGGSGCSFDWSLLNAYRGTVPFLLSGGIGPDTDISSVHHPKLAGIDLNSRFETAPALKNIEILKPFVEKIANTQTNG